MIALTKVEQRNLRVWSDAKEMSRGPWKVDKVTGLAGLFVSLPTFVPPTNTFCFKRFP